MRTTARVAVALIVLLPTLVVVQPVSASGSVVLSPSSGSSGTEVSISGSGWAADLGCTVWFDEVETGECSITSGNLSGSLVVPGRPPGTYQ